MGAIALKNITAHLINQARQRRTVSNRGQPLTLTGQYTGRDTRTGARQLRDPFGGVRYARYISNSVPDTFPALLVRNQSGLLGNVDQKPS